MVEVLCAVRGLENSARIGLEAGGINRNRDGAFVKSLLHLAVAVWGHVHVVMHVGDALGLVMTAGAILGLVSIILFTLDLVGFQVLESSLHDSAIAALVSEAP